MSIGFIKLLEAVLILAEILILARPQFEGARSNQLVIEYEDRFDIEENKVTQNN